MTTEIGNERTILAVLRGTRARTQEQLDALRGQLEALRRQREAERAAADGAAVDCESCFRRCVPWAAERTTGALPEGLLRAVSCGGAGGGAHPLCSECLAASVRTFSGKETCELLHTQGDFCCPFPHGGLAAAQSPAIPAAALAAVLPEDAFRCILDAKRKAAEAEIAIAADRRRAADRATARDAARRLARAAGLASEAATVIHGGEGPAARMAREAAAAAEGALLSMLKEEAVEALCPSCPNCTQAFVDYNGCSALSCSRCDCRFCAFCLHSSRIGPAASDPSHAHVATRPRNPDRRNGVFARGERGIPGVVAALRRSRVLAVLAVPEASEAVRTAALQSLRPHLTQDELFELLMALRAGGGGAAPAGGAAAAAAAAARVGAAVPADPALPLSPRGSRFLFGDFRWR